MVSDLRDLRLAKVVQAPGLDGLAAFRENGEEFDEASFRGLPIALFVPDKGASADEAGKWQRVGAALEGKAILVAVLDGPSPVFETSFRFPVAARLSYGLASSLEMADRDGRFVLCSAGPERTVKSYLLKAGSAEAIIREVLESIKVNP